MASLSVGGATPGLRTPSTTRMLKLHPVLNYTPFFTTPSLFSPENLSLRSSNHRAGVVCMSTTTSPVSKDDEKLINGQPNEKVVQVSSWIDYLPKEIQSFAKLARVDKPIATIAASTGNIPDFKNLAVFACAAPFFRGAACTINDFFDRDFDKMVERTKERPMASGAVTPFQGLCFFAFQLLLSHGIFLQLTNYSAISEAAYIACFSKNITLRIRKYSLTINWGAVLGWYAVKGSLQPSIVYSHSSFLVVSGLFCMTPFMLISAGVTDEQDKEDDVKVGVKSTTLKFGESTKEWITGFAIASIGTLTLAAYNAALGWPFYVFLAAASGQLGWQIRTVNLSSPADCNRKFVSNKWFGVLILSGILLGRVFS
ncbi:4-hydroxybenzoate polyprenyltransferase, mitochondrial-like [Gossypium australe]|uniref:4-hydroxybenzoate polyprenyltransferase, mitochondrial-like n=1 Tax=Gossypium australe TaxID=47621 RepID=A0A5B6V0I0_9ROSI|nr:4-hydroxybenzoate polyprenyltransferase, mitochondrial-like [Gossypium australe]